MELKDTLTISVSLILGSCVLIFSFLQWRIAKHKLRLDLFEKRYKVYEAAIIYISSVTGCVNVKNDALHDYNRGTMDAVFLFGPKINDYLKELRGRTLQLSLYSKQIEPLPVGEERSVLAEKIKDELIWLSDQFICVPLVFAPYLGFGKAR